MATVLFLVHVPYQSHSPLNEIILQKKRDLEAISNEDSNASATDEADVAPKEEEDVTEEEKEEGVLGNEESSESIQNESDTLNDRNPDQGEEESSPEIEANKTRSRVNFKDSIRSNDPKNYKKLLSEGGLTEAVRVYNLLKKFNIKRASWEFTEDGEYWQVMFPFASRLCDKLFNEFLKLGIGNNNYTSISVLPITINFPSMLGYDGEDEWTDIDGNADVGGETDEAIETAGEANKQKKSSDKSQFMQSIKSRLTVAQVIGSVRTGSQLTFDYLMLIIMAGIIAGIGLIENSSVLLVASMLVSPLMGPILGGTFGIVIRHSTLWKTGVRNELIGLGICVIVGLVFGLCASGASAIHVTEEMSSRCKERSLMIGVFVAIPSGAGVALSILGGNAGSLVGVAISASLLPPAVNAGMFFAYAIVNSANPRASPIPTNGTMTTTPVPTTTPVTASKDSLYDYEARDLATMGSLSLLLTFVNIVIIFVMGVCILKVKELTPGTATAVTKSFWKMDLKTTREYLKGHMMAIDQKMEDAVLEDWQKEYDLDLSNKATLKAGKGAVKAQELKKVIEKLELDPSFNQISRRTGKPQGPTLMRIKSRLDPDLGSSRFAVNKVCDVVDTSFLGKRFQVARLRSQTEDEVASLHDSTIDLNKSGTERMRMKLLPNEKANLKTSAEAQLLKHEQEVAVEIMQLEADKCADEVSTV